MSKKIGVYICSGCGIADAIDLDEVAKLAPDDFQIPICKQHAALCSAEGLQVIKDDIANEGVNTILVAACSPRAKQDEFTFGGVYVERTNLREHVAWCQPEDADKEDVTMLAQDYVRMGLAKLGKIEDLVGYDVGEIDKTILVVGGGLTGLTAALEVAKTGYRAVLVEKEAQLGGLMGQCHKRYPTAAPYEELRDTGIRELVAKVEANADITVHTGTTVVSIEGGPGLFDVTLDGAVGDVRRVGAIVQATGALPYDATRLGHLGYGECKDVVTQLELEAMAKRGRIVRPSDGQPAKSVAFVQCAGSRDPEHLSYCSGHCCLTSLKQAQYLRQQDQEARVFVIYKDMRTPGHYEDFYRAAQNDDGIFLTKGEIAGVSQNGGELRVDIDNTLVGEAVSLDVDLVVLATGLVTSMAGLDEDDSILGLRYRQGPDLPELVNDFPDSHFICFPYETRRTGIYAAGTVRCPMDGARAENDAAGAGLKAIQCVEMTSRGEAVHPRSGEITFPDFFLQRCTQCKRCTEECPFGTLNEDAKGTPQPNPTRCRRCGICMGACPERIVSFPDYSVDIIGSMIKAVHVPDEFEEKPRIICLACENDAYPALDVGARRGLSFSPWVRFIPVRCLGSVNIVWIADALSRGIDGLLMLGCKFGDDYQCHYVRGSELCNTRLENVQDTLERLMLDRERINIEQVQLSDWDKLPTLVNDFAEAIGELEPNPYKDM